MQQPSRTTPSATATLASVTEDGEPVVWSVLVAHHFKGMHVGRRVLVEDCLPIARTGPALGPGVLDDEHISRDHAELRIENDQLVVEDRGSHNGTFVNDARVGTQPLQIGDIVRMGRVLLLVDRSRKPPEVEVPDDLPGISDAYLRVVATLRRAAGRAAPVLLWGETGTGKTTMARFVHACRSPGSPLVLVRAASLPADRIAGEALIERARGGTLVLEGIDEATGDVQRYLVEWLDKVDSGEAARRVQVIASSLADPDELIEWGKLRGDLLHRFRGWRVRLPPLRERRADIVVLAHAIARRYAGHKAELDRALTTQLLRHDWPGNVRELESILERAAAQSEAQQCLRTFPELPQLLRTGAPPSMVGTTTAAAPRPPAPSAGLTLQRDGWWYRTPQGETQDLRRRKTLARVLSVLIQHREQATGNALPIPTLLALAWPDQKMDRKAGANRVYVALTTLRKMGLREVLVRTEDGYMLDPAKPVVIED